MRNPRTKEANITIVTSLEVVTLLQISVNHLAMSIDDGSYDLKGINEEAIMANLFELNCYFDRILEDLS